MFSFLPFSKLDYTSFSIICRQGLTACDANNMRKKIGFLFIEFLYQK